MTARRGFALLAVLWITVALAVLSVGLSTVARLALGTAHNRISSTHAEWAARACMERVRAVIATGLDTAHSEKHGLSGWSALDQLVEDANLRTDGCTVTVRSSGDRLNVNEIDPEILGTLLSNLGIPASTSDSLSAALVDWRDVDDIAHDHGAERIWYAKNGRVPPRNGPLADIRELKRVRGFEHLELDSVLGVEAGRLDLNHAPLADIASLPGMTAEAVMRLTELRESHVPIGDLATFGSRLSLGARRQLIAEFGALSAVTTSESDAWIITARVDVGVPAVSAVVESRFVRAGTRAAIVRWRMLTS